MKLHEDFKLEICPENFNNVYIVDLKRKKRSYRPISLDKVEYIVNDYLENLKSLENINLPKEFEIEVNFKEIDEKDYVYTLSFLVLRKLVSDRFRYNYFCNSTREILEILNKKMEMDKNISILNSGLELKY